MLVRDARPSRGSTALTQTNQPVANTPATCPAAIKRSPILTDGDTLFRFGAMPAGAPLPFDTTMIDYVPDEC